MFTPVVHLLGGLGLFLLGMIVMTDGLKGLAGDYLNRVLARFTGSPLSGAVTGSISTAMMQSSSATTVAAVGFVGAGLLTFPQALGVIFGANFGTTVTGWLVALLGLKLQIGSLLFPFILLGALMRLFGHGRWQHAGYALAGFALLFQGIAVLQDAMAAYQGLVTPADFPADGLFGRLQLLAIGVAVTLVTQSSSAGVATALTAVYTGTISFPQAAALVIGMDVGTTVTAVIATLGGSADTRRTGYSHVIYNLLTAIGALLLLTPYTWLWEALSPTGLHRHAELALVGFHSLFNLMGVVLVIPFAAQFARLMYRLVPAPQDPVLDRLDRQLLQNPDVALDSVARILSDTSVALFDVLHVQLQSRSPDPVLLDRIGRHLDASHVFVDQIHLQPGQRRNWDRLNAMIHILDHLQRLAARCREQPREARQLDDAAVLRQQATRVAEALGRILGDLATQGRADAARVAEQCAAHLRGQSAGLRDSIMAEVAEGTLDVPTGTQRLESIRWLRRVGYHVWRVCDHLARLEGPTPRQD